LAYNSWHIIYFTNKIPVYPESLLGRDKGGRGEGQSRLKHGFNVLRRMALWPIDSP